MRQPGVGARLGRAGRSAGSRVRGIGRLTRRASHAQGADRTGLGHLIELSAVSSAADALVAVALAGTVFFGLPVDEARGQVLLYLCVTMAPFALVAPLIGPVLDRMRAARRFAIAGTLVLRGVLCWGMAGAVAHGDALTLLPMAFGALVLSKAYGVSRSAVTPRLLPAQITLVTANARASFAMLIAAAVAAPAGAGLARFIGVDWLLRIATLVFIVGALMGVRLPRKVDEPDAAQRSTDSDGVEDGTVRWRTLLRAGPVVAEALRANLALRVFSGFLVLYLAFLLREQRFGSVSANLALALLVGAAGAGGLVGTGAGAWIKARDPGVLILGSLVLATAAAVVCAVLFWLWAALAVAFVGAFAQSLGKLGMDAIVQREIGEEVRSSSFAVSETLHQLAWVIGGVAGLGMSLFADGRIALAVMAAALGALFGTLMAQRGRRRRAGRARRAGNPQPDGKQRGMPAPAVRPNAGS
jgi:MFS family permease